MCGFKKNAKKTAQLIGGDQDGKMKTSESQKQT